MPSPRRPRACRVGRIASARQRLDRPVNWMVCPCQPLLPPVASPARCTDAQSPRGSDTHSPARASRPASIQTQLSGMADCRVASTPTWPHRVRALPGRGRFPRHGRPGQHRAAGLAHVAGAEQHCLHGCPPPGPRRQRLATRSPFRTPIFLTRVAPKPVPGCGAASPGNPDILDGGSPGTGEARRGRG